MQDVSRDMVGVRLPAKQRADYRGFNARSRLVAVSPAALLCGQSRPLSWRQNTMSDTKTWDDTFTAICDAEVFPYVVHRVLLAGWPRTGKSTLPGKLFGVENVERTTLHRQMPVDDLIGGLGLVNGSTAWQDGPAVRALRHGRKLVLDEIDRHSGEIYSFLLAILDDPAGVTLPTGERVNAARGFGVIATTNEQPSKLADALYDRFDLVLKVDTLSKGLQRALGAFAEPARNVIGRGGSGNRLELDWSRPATVNLFIAASKLRNHGLDDSEIAETLGLTEMETVDFLAAVSSSEG